MLEILIIAYATMDDSSARYICGLLDVRRSPHDPADAVALAFAKRAVPLLRSHIGDAAGLLDAAKAEGILGQITLAMLLPDWLVLYLAPVQELVAVFNSGGGTGWRPRRVRESERFGDEQARQVSNRAHEAAVDRPYIVDSTSIAGASQPSSVSGRTAACRKVAP